MSCPLCNYEFRCPCESCISRQTSDWKYVSDSFNQCDKCKSILNMQYFYDLTKTRDELRTKLEKLAGGK